MPKTRINLGRGISIRLDPADVLDIEAEEYATGVTKANIIRRDIKAQRNLLFVQRGFRYPPAPLREEQEDPDEMLEESLQAAS